MQRSKPQGTISLDEIKKNIVELQYRFQSLVNPEYEILELYDPNTKSLRSLRLNRVEWWEEWKRQERFLSFAQRIPFKRLGEVRASTDDHCFQQISKVLEDFTIQVDLLSQFLALQARAAPPASVERQANEQEYDLPEIPAEPISKAQLAPPEEDNQEDEAQEEEEEDDDNGQLELVEDDDEPF